MKRLNLKLIAILGLGLLLCGVAVVVAHQLNKVKTAQSFKEQAEQAEKDGNKDEALSKYLKYLAKADDEPEVYIKVATLGLECSPKYLQPSVVRKTYDVMGKGIRKYHDHQALREAYARYLLRLTTEFRYNDLIKDTGEQLDYLTKQPKHDPEWDVKLMTNLIQRGYYDEAMKNAGELVGFSLDTAKFDSATAKAPNEVQAYSILARLLRERAEPKRPDDADAVIEQMIVVNDKSYKAHLERARYLVQYYSADSNQKRREAKLETAHKDIEVAQKLDDKAVEPIIAAVETALTERKFDDAKPLLEKGLKEHPDSVAMHRFWAFYNMEQNHPEAARADLDKAVAAQPKEADLHWILLEVQIQMRDLDAARKTIKTLGQLGFPKPFLDLSEARVLLTEGKYLPASQLLEKIRPDLASFPEQMKESDLFAAQCYEQLGQYDKQKDACDRVLQLDKTNIPAQVGLASALMNLGKKESASELYNQLAARLGKNKALETPQLWVPLIELRLDEVSKKPPEERDWKPVENIVNALEKSNVQPLTLALVKSEVELRKGDADAARKTLEAAKEAGKDDPRYWVALSTCIGTQKGKENGPEGALKALDSAPEAVRDTVLVRLNRATMLIRQGADNVKSQLMALDANSDKLSPGDKAKLWSGMGYSLLLIGDKEGAGKYWLRVADLSPDDIQIRFHLLNLARDSHDDAVLERVQNDLGRIVGKKSAEARFAEAVRLISSVQKEQIGRTQPGQRSPPPTPEGHAQLVSARKLLDEVKQSRNNWHEVERAMGDVEFLDANMDAAVPHYESAVQLGPNNPVTIRALAYLYTQRGETKKLQELMARVGSANVAGLGLEQVNVETLLSEGKKDEALELAKKLCPDDAKDPYKHLWLSNVYNRVRQPDDAEASLRRAVDIGSELPETWILLIQHLVANGKKSEAEKLVLEARKKLPEDRVNQVLGPGYEAVGQFEAAEEYYRLAIKQSPEDMANRRVLAGYFIRTGRKDEAKTEILNVLRMAKGNPKLKEQLAWGRRELAQIMASSGEYNDFLKAKALLKENIDELDDSQDDKLKLANMLAARANEPVSWREAVQWFEKARPPLSPRDRLSLARLHDMTGNWEKARNEMVTLLTSNPEQQTYNAFVEMLLRHDLTADAQTWIDRLEKKQFAGWFLRAKLLVKEGKGAEAVVLLKRVIPQRPIPADKIAILQSVAILADKLGLNDAAEELYREYASYDPDQGNMPLASLLARTGKVDEALDLCEKSLNEQPKAVVMEVANGALRAKPRMLKKEQIARVEKWYNQLLSKDADSIGLAMQYADFLDISGRAEESIKKMRQLLERKDLKSLQKAIVLNNMAYLLAYQKKDLAEAMTMITQAGDTIGYNSDIVDTRGTIYLAMQKYKEAVDDFTQATMIPEPSAVKLMHLAMAQDLNGDKSGAKDTLQRSKDSLLDTTALNKFDLEEYERLVRDVGDQ